MIPVCNGRLRRARSQRLTKGRQAANASTRTIASELRSLAMASHDAATTTVMSTSATPPTCTDSNDATNTTTAPPPRAMKALESSLGRGVERPVEREVGTLLLSVDGVRLTKSLHGITGRAVKLNGASDYQGRRKHPPGRRGPRRLHRNNLAGIARERPEKA